MCYRIYSRFQALEKKNVEEEELVREYCRLYVSHKYFSAQDR